jgi:uncharacterized protein
VKSPKLSSALITGASSGIGEALARLLAEKGIQLIVVARNKEKLHALARDLSHLVPVEVLACDLSDADQRQTLIKAIHSRKPDLIINNAGFGRYGDVLTYDSKEMIEMVEVDVTALMEISIEGARALVSAGKEGVIMNVSSAAAFQIFPSFSVYAASKAFVNLFSESFDFEVAPLGVRVLTCCPGMVDTHFRHRASGDPDQKASPGSMSVDFAAKEIWRQVQKKKRLHVFDWKYRFLTGVSRLLPKSWLAKATKGAMAGRYPKREIIHLGGIKD